MVPEAVRDWLLDHQAGQIVSSWGVGGGCINHGQRIETTSGKTYFLKTNSQAPADMFAREADGLKILVVKGGPRLPIPYLAGIDFLLLEHLTPVDRRSDYWSILGRQLAELHFNTAQSFGFTHDNYIGSTPQSNTWSENGFDFFVEQRLLFQARLANRRGLLSSREVQQVEQLGRRLTELIPVQPASLLHGDLWSGNQITDDRGMPALIDPAAYYGWAEAELAMTCLFGAFPPSFYQAYQQVRHLEIGFRERFPIYNLYHLINHLNLFGRSYHIQVQAVISQFS